MMSRSGAVAATASAQADAANSDVSKEIGVNPIERCGQNAQLLHAQVELFRTPKTNVQMLQQGFVKKYKKL